MEDPETRVWIGGSAFNIPKEMAEIPGGRNQLAILLRDAFNAGFELARGKEEDVEICGYMTYYDDSPASIVTVNGEEVAKVDRCSCGKERCIADEVAEGYAAGYFAAKSGKTTKECRGSE